MKINKKQVRSFSINDTQQSEDKKYISMSLSSETPYLRSFGNEILLHGSDNVDLSRAMHNGLPLLVNHNSENLPVGRLKNLHLDPATKKLRGDAYFSNRPEAQEVKQDMLDGILSDVSIGYKILDYNVDKATKADTPNNVYVTRWMPYEGSIVGIPADYSVGVGRADNSMEEMELELEEEEEEETEDGTQETGAVEDAESQSSEGDPILAPLPTQAINAESPSETAQEAQEVSAEAQESPTDAEVAEEQTEETQQEEDTEDEEENTLNAESGLGVSQKKNNDEIELLIKKEIELKAIRKSILNLNIKSEKEIDLIIGDKSKSIEDIKKELITVSPNILTSKKSITKDNKMDEMNLYRSLQNAIKGDYTNVDEKLLNSGFLATKGQGFNADLFLTRLDSYTTTANGGTNTIYEQNIGFLDLLRARTAVLNAGGKTKVGIGNLSYIRQKQAVTAVLRGENTGAVTASNADFEKIPYSPKALVAKVFLTDELQKESIVDLQNILRDDMVKQFAIAIDNYAINGNTTPAITGLLSAGSGIYNGDLGTAALPSWAAVNHLKGLVDQKAVDLSKCAFITTPALNAVMEATQMFPNYGNPISAGNKINGYSVFTSSNVPVSTVDHTLIFGDFSSLEICLQGPIEFMVDTTTRFDEGITILTARQYFDVGVLHGAGFAKTANFLIA